MGISLFPCETPMCCGECQQDISAKTYSDEYCGQNRIGGTPASKGLIITGVGGDDVYDGAVFWKKDGVDGTSGLAVSHSTYCTYFLVESPESCSGTQGSGTYLYGSIPYDAEVTGAAVTHRTVDDYGPHYTTITYSTAGDCVPTCSAGCMTVANNTALLYYALCLSMDAIANFFSDTHEGTHGASMTFSIGTMCPGKHMSSCGQQYVTMVQVSIPSYSFTAEQCCSQTDSAVHCYMPYNTVKVYTPNFDCHVHGADCIIDGATQDLIYQGHRDFQGDVNGSYAAGAFDTDGDFPFPEDHANCTPGITGDSCNSTQHASLQWPVRFWYERQIDMSASLTVTSGQVSGATLSAEISIHKDSCSYDTEITVSFNWSFGNCGATYTSDPPWCSDYVSKTSAKQAIPCSHFGLSLRISAQFSGSVPGWAYGNLNDFAPGSTPPGCGTYYGFIRGYAISGSVTLLLN